MTASKTHIIKKTFSLEELPKIAAQFASMLKQSETRPFVVWFLGDLGAGKTTFVGALLHALGLPAGVPVLSPTYTFLTEYETSLGLCAHMDLYRLVEGDIDSVESLLSGRTYQGLLVEWPLRAASSPYLSKSHQVSLDFSDSPECRTITIESAR